jgi:EmrB/QacA subfamily drug resistance transporter
LTRKRLNYMIAAIVLSLFLASMEGTVVATAMPTIVAQLGGFSIYSWVFAVYMLTSTTTVPLFGKLSDLFSRKAIYMISMALFLVGSVLCGSARSMDQLIFFRAIQGLGAGGVLPMAFTIVGDLFSLEQRARLQGLFSGIWGVSSIIGPLIGGFLVDTVSWHWVFLINLFPGAIALTLVWFAWKEERRTDGMKVSIDFLGAGLLTLTALMLLLGVSELGTPLGWGFLGASAILAMGLYWAERKAVDPILPLRLFRDRLFSVSITHGFLSGWAMFGSLSYVPLFVQAVIGTSATQAGLALMPMSLFWTLASIWGSRMLLKRSYRSLAVIGMLLLVAGAFLMTRIGVHTSQYEIMIYTAMMGTGMGLSVPAFLVAVQTAVNKKDLGIATSTVQYSRSIGGTIGVSVLGAFLSSGLASQLLHAGLDPTVISLNDLVDPVAGAAAAVQGPLRDALAIAMAGMFLISLGAAAAGLVAVFFSPKGKVTEIRQEGTAEECAD